MSQDEDAPIRNSRLLYNIVKGKILSIFSFPTVCLLGTAYEIRWLETPRTNLYDDQRFYTNSGELISRNDK